MSLKENYPEEKLVFSNLKEKINELATIPFVEHKEEMYRATMRYRIALLVSNAIWLVIVCGLIATRC